MEKKVEKRIADLEAEQRKLIEERQKTVKEMREQMRKSETRILDIRAVLVELYTLLGKTPPEVSEK